MTEPEYLLSFIKWKRNPAVEVEIPNVQGDPSALLDAALRRKDEATALARREKDENLLFDEVWCVSDVDEHRWLKETLDKAGANDIKIALSNPCFELWLYLHFAENPGLQDRHAMQRRAKDAGDGAISGKRLDFDLLKPGYDDAVGRALRLTRHAEEDAEPRRNPTTSVYLLTEPIANGSSTLAGPAADE